MVGLDIKAERERVATAVRGVVPTKWTVYPSTPTTLVFPALVVRPGNEYLTRITRDVWQVGLSLDVFQTVAAGAVGQDVFDALMAELLPQLLSITDIRFGGVQSVGQMRTEGGAPVVFGSIPLSI